LDFAQKSNFATEPESLLDGAVIATPWLPPWPWLLCLDLDLRDALLGKANLRGGSL